MSEEFLEKDNIIAELKARVIELEEKHNDSRTEKDIRDMINRSYSILESELQQGVLLFMDLAMSPTRIIYKTVDNDNNTKTYTITKQDINTKTPSELRVELINAFKELTD